MSSYKRDVSPQPRTVNKGDNRRKKVSLASEQQIQIKEAFDLFDPHKTSHITYHELKVILRALGFDIKKSQVVQLAREFDIDESGRISYQDYVEIMKRKYGQRDPIEETLKAFRLFDVQCRGRISLTDLRRVAKELGQVLKQQQLIAMIQQFDHDNDGQINQQQFLAILRPSII